MHPPDKPPLLDSLGTMCTWQKNPHLEQESMIHAKKLRSE